MTSRRAPRPARGTGPVVLVTGSARRLGRALALRFGAAGCFTFVHYLTSRAEAQSVLDAIRAAGGDGALVRGDLSRPAGVDAVVRAVRARTARLDVLVNNVGIYRTGDLATFPPDAFDRILQANLSGCYRLVHGLLPLVPRGGCIVNIGYAGVDAPTATTHNTAYMISKSGLLLLTKSLALALGPRGVRVNMVSPGILSNSVELPRDPAEFVPLGTLGDVADVADAVEFLAGPRARYITGTNLDVAGGYNLALRSLEEHQKPPSRSPRIPPKASRKRP